MDNLPGVLDNVLQELDKYDDLREQLIVEARTLNRLSGRGIANLVKGNEATQLVEAQESFQKIKKIMETIVPIVSWRTSISGVEEYGELVILNSLLSGNGIPSPEITELPSWIWLSSLGDVVGELRRIILNKLLADEFEQAKLFLSYMQDIFHEIHGLTFSKSMIPNFRKKVDVARMSVERTEGDVLNYKLSVKNEGP